MLKIIDSFINSTTMYKLVLYALLILFAASLLFSLTGVLSYGAPILIYSAAILLFVCFITNELLSRILKAPVNIESWSITAMILFFLFKPVESLQDFYVLIISAVIAMLSKYIFAYNRKHIFNPAAFAAFALSFTPVSVALWWAGTPYFFPIVLIVGMAVVRKIRKFSLFFAFIIAGSVGTFIFGLFSGNLNLDLYAQVFLSGPLLFLGTIMLTEPLTLPPKRRLQIIYGSIVGLIQAVPFSIGMIYSTPEMALVIGNLFSFIVSPKSKLFLTLSSKQKIAADTYEFTFGAGNLKFQAGQYLEWTIPHSRPDIRGVRRFFTIASSPFDNQLKIAIRFFEKSSSFKKTLMDLKKDQTITASQLAGDFVLPSNRDQKLVFIAGGIGVTPFVSMIRYLLDTNQKRNITLFYFNRTQEEIAYKNLFDTADKIGLKTVYSLTDTQHISQAWQGKQGRLDKKMLSQEVPDYEKCLYYLSGPSALVGSYKKILLDNGIKRDKIRTDYFPGF